MLEIITSDALSTRHGFFTRKGGASSGIFAGLNCGTGSTDQAEAVAINRARVAEALDLAPDHLVSVHQVHSPDAVTITAPRLIRPQADAMVTATPGLGLAILTADCQPVLFADIKAHVIGAAHAGWRGAKDGVLEATVVAMEALGATRANITAVVGPCISQSAYEVGPEFFETFTDDEPETRRFFAQGKGDRVLFDLPGFGVWRLREAGVGHAEWTRHCTFSDASRFFSYRRTTHAGEADYGRLLSVIRL
ncbi:MAG: pgeF [Cypionkella sp.]|uniref:peptidoglycan editing factor PgeF n=1 Tax=Cypionkella sp. TaxID=2811411 RepID=UPI00260C6808|nr:peptidoglycan editing factor PgeF [Cypionkella sp.]MDB5659208.1 pgeF [Cypionkella sp.]